MMRITLKGIRGHVFRFILTTLAVVLGVGFVVASFVLRDGLKETFNGLVEDINADTDVQVRGVTEFSETDFQDDPLIDASVLETVRGVDGVAEAIGGTGFDGIIPVRSNGEPMETFGPPLFGFNYVDSPLSPTFLSEGSAPGQGKFVMDLDTAANEDFVIGETYDVIFPNGTESFRLSGLVSFGEDNATLGAVITLYNEAQFQELTGTVGQIQTVSVRAESGVGASELAAAIQAELPAGAEAVTTDTIVEEGQADFGQILDILGSALTGFALVSLLVASFLISNIFNITVGQRVRELALMRAIGATTTQVRTSVLTEAVLIGVLASVIGIGFGALLALGIRALLNAGGFGLPAFGVSISTSTVIIAVSIAMIVTLLASLSPAFQAGRVPPVAAMREGYQIEGRPRQRLILGIVLTLIGAILMANGLFGSPSGTGLIVALGLGSVLVFVGVTTLSPLFAAPVVSIIGAPLKYVPWLGVSGQLARQNSARSARSTAAAAGALMIGLALVSGAGVFGASLKQTISGTLETSIQADYFVQQDGFGVGFGAELANQMRESDDFAQVASFRFGNIRVNGSDKEVFATNFDQLDGLINPGVIAGSISDADANSILLHEDPATDLGVGPGDVLSIDFASGESTELTIAAVYTDALILGNWVIDVATWDRYFSAENDLFVAARIADGTDIETARATLDTIAKDFPQVLVEDQAEFRESQESQIDDFIGIINSMLYLALLIAVLGITITMTLAVFERTREIGLLRAVGMTSRQARSMVRWEAAIIAIFGAVLGTVIGVIFGWAAVTAIPDSIVNTFAVPWGSLILFMVISAVAGLLAGLYPAWRAGRMNVLDAISHL